MPVVSIQTFEDFRHTPPGRRTDGRRQDGTRETVPATYDPGTDRRYAPVTLASGDIAFVDRGGIVDLFGEFNGQPSDIVSG